MSTVKEHLQDGWARHAEHHIAKNRHHSGLSKSHATYAEAHKAMMDECDDDSPESEFYKAGHAFHLEKAEHHADVAQEHADMADFCVECAKTLAHTQKAMGMEGDRLVPDLISGLAPEMPQHVRAVPRHGQRELGKAEFSPVEQTLEKIFSDD